MDLKQAYDTAECIAEVKRLGEQLVDNAIAKIREVANSGIELSSEEFKQVIQNSTNEFKKMHQTDLVYREGKKVLGLSDEEWGERFEQPLDLKVFENLVSILKESPLSNAKHILDMVEEVLTHEKTALAALKKVQAHIVSEIKNIADNGRELLPTEFDQRLCNSLDTAFFEEKTGLYATMNHSAREGRALLDAEHFADIVAILDDKPQADSSYITKYANDRFDSLTLNLISPEVFEKFLPFADENSQIIMIASPEDVPVEILSRLAESEDKYVGEKAREGFQKAIMLFGAHGLNMG